MKTWMCLLLGLSAGLASAEKMSRKEWIDRLAGRFPEILCDEKGYFLNCFSVETAACKMQIQKNLTNCTGRLVPPSTIDTDQNGIEWSEEIGRCVGDATEKALKKLEKRPPECADIRKWL